MCQCINREVDLTEHNHIARHAYLCPSKDTISNVELEEDYLILPQWRNFIVRHYSVTYSKGMSSGPFSSVALSSLTDEWIHDEETQGSPSSMDRYNRRSVRKTWVACPVNLTMTMIDMRTLAVQREGCHRRPSTTSRPVKYSPMWRCRISLQYDSSRRARLHPCVSPVVERRISVGSHSREHWSKRSVKNKAYWEQTHSHTR